VALVFIPAQLRRLTAGRDRLEVAGGTLGELVDAIDGIHPGFRARVVADGELLPSIAVSVDGDLVSGGLAEPVGPESEVHFVPALGGGQDPSDDYTRTFEARGDAYNAAHGLAPGARVSERALLLERLDLAPGLAILDVPAGGGYVADGLRAAEPSLRVVSVEPAARFAAGIDRRFARVRGSLDRLPVGDARFDRVASLAGTHHLEDRLAFFRECRRVLRPGGRFVVADAAEDTPVASFLNGPVDRYSETGHAGRFFAAGEAARLLADAGFAAVEEELVQFAWRFPDLDTLVAFAHSLFGLTRADRATVERVLRQHFALEVDATGARLPWSLLYARGVAG